MHGVLFVGMIGGVLGFFFFGILILFRPVLLLRLEAALVVYDLDVLVNSRASGWFDQRH